MVSYSLINQLRPHYFFFLQDSGVRAIVSGLVVASSRVLIASSLNLPRTKAIPEACVCQKPYSGYIKLITEWRQHLFRKDPGTVIRLYPFGDDDSMTPDHGSHSLKSAKIAVRLRGDAEGMGRA